MVLFYNRGKSIEERKISLNTVAKIKSDNTGRIRRILDKVEFDGNYTFVTELLQNCQRSGSTNVEVTLEGDTFEIKDNGKGCENPQELFTLDVSGFGVGFGVGFSSVYTLLGKVHVHSLNWQGEIDMGEIAKKRVIKEEDLELPLNKAPFYQGFIVRVQSPVIEEKFSRIEREFRKVSSTMTEFRFVLNGEEIPKKNLLKPPTSSRFYEVFDHSFYHGMLYVDTMHEYKGVDVYYEGRFVQNLYHGLTGLSGNIMVKKNKVNLKAPDRSSIIWDEKRDMLQAKLEKDLRNLLIWILKEGSADEIEHYADVIRSHIPVDKFLRYLQIDEGKLKNQFEVREGAKEKEETNEVQDVFEENNIQQETDGIENGRTIDRKRTQEDVSFSSFVSETPVTQRISKDELNKVNISNIKKKANVVWVEKNKQDIYKELIAKYEYYGLYCFISPHELYDDALRYLGITHIAEVENEAIEKQYNVTNIGAKNKKEMRVMEVLSMIEQCLNLPQTFYLSDIQCKMIVCLQEKRIYQEKLFVEGYQQGGVIHLNRKSLSFGKISGANLGKDELNLHEVKFILANIVLLSHEISHIFGSKDNTLEHYEIQDNIQKKIGQFILNLD